METSTDPKTNPQDSPVNSPQSRQWVKFSEDQEESASGPEVESSKNADPTTPTAAVIEPSVEIHQPSSLISRPPSSSTPITKTNNTSSNSLHNKNSNSGSGGVNSASSSSVLHSSHRGGGGGGDNATNYVHNVSNLHNVELHNSESAGGHQHNVNGGRRNNTGFTNGDVIVSVLPTNTRWPWITPASFRPELVPEELMAVGFTLTVEEYVHAMELLTSDLRFNAYTICYKRLLASWLSAAFLILLIILFSEVKGIGLFALGITWLIINAAAVFLCMYIKIKINQGLERCMAKVNKLLIKHKLLVGLDDRGKLSCHKVHLCFIYFDPTDCIKRLEQVLDGVEDRQRVQRSLDVTEIDIIITGTTPQRIPQKQKGERTFLRYAQRWAKDFLRRRLDWTVGEGGENPSAPRHLPSALCPCQYVEEYLKHKKFNAPPENSCNSSSWWPCYPSNR